MTELKRLEKEYHFIQTMKDMLHLLRTYYAEKRGRNKALLDVLWNWEIDCSRNLEKVKKEILSAVRQIL